MSESTRDGTGRGYRARVTQDKRLSTNAISESVVDAGAIVGDTYNIATSPITITGTTESAIFYIRNLDERDLLISSVFLNTFNSVGTLNGSQPILKVVRNPIAGSLITNQVAAGVISNNNFGTNLFPNATIYEGVDGDTFTSFNLEIPVPLPTRAAVTFLEFATRVVLKRGSSYGIKYQPEAGSTSVDVITGGIVTVLPKEF
jgi:hypothetical protein